MVTRNIKIVRLTRSGGKVTLDLSESDEPLVVSEEIALRHRLVEGVVITPAQLDQLRRESRFTLCDGEAARLLGQREHSAGELRTKLVRKKFDPEIIQEVIRKYRDRGIVDDAHYAYKLAERLVAERPCGRSFLVAYLRRKMIDHELAESTADLVLTGREEIDLAALSLGHRWPQLVQFELETARLKAYNYLARRGFSYPAARAAFEKLANRKSEVDNDQNI